MKGIAVEEEDCADGLILGGGRGFSIHNKVGNELIDLCHSHFARVPFIVKEDIFPHPLDVSLFGAIRVLFDANIIPELVEEFFGFLG